VYKSLNNLSAQIIDDSKATVLVSAATFAKSLKSTIGYGGNVKAAEQLGTVLAEKALAKGIKVVVFDRGGCLYHGRIKAFADGIRKGGVVF
jgi:large subunit ribosomal protein L18